MVNTAIDWEVDEVIQTNPGDSDGREDLEDSSLGSAYRRPQGDTTPGASRVGPRFPGMDQLEVLLEDPLISLWASEFGRRRYVTRMDALAALAVALDLPEPGPDQTTIRGAACRTPVDRISG